MGSIGPGLGYDFIAPCAIGDIDLDGVAEVVGAYNTAVFAVEMKSSTMDFLINTGGATARDLEALGEEVRRRVQAHADVTLDWEIQRIGYHAAGIGSAEDGAQ